MTESAAALRQAQLKLMEQVIKSVDGLAKDMKTLNGKVDEVRERMIRLESRDYEREISRLEAANATLEARIAAQDARLLTLEAIRSRNEGALSVGQWFTRSMPWLLAVGASIGALFGWLRDSSPN